MTIANLLLIASNKSNFYCDIRPNMVSDPFLCRHIKTIDALFCDDLQKLINDDIERNPVP